LVESIGSMEVGTVAEGPRGSAFADSTEGADDVGVFRFKGCKMGGARAGVRAVGGEGRWVRVDAGRVEFALNKFHAVGGESGKGKGAVEALEGFAEVVAVSSKLGCVAKGRRVRGRLRRGRGGRAVI
jgi:hypothetical protein